MAKGAPNYLFFCCLLFVLTVCSSGKFVDFSYDAREDKAPQSQIRVIVADFRVLSSLSNTDASVSIYLNKTLVQNLKSYLFSSTSKLKQYIKTKSIILIPNTYDLMVEKNLPDQLLSTLKSVHFILRTLRLETGIEVSVSLPLPLLESLDQQQEMHLHRVLNLIKKAHSFVTIEARVHGELTMGNRNSPVVLITKSASAVPSAAEIADKISRSLGNSNQIKGRVIRALAEEFEQKEEKMFHSSHRQLLQSLEGRQQHDIIYPPTTTFPIASPSITTPVTIPPENNFPAPTIVTVPSTYPVTVTPNPATPATVPFTTPVPMPLTDPVTSPVPVTNPVTTPSTVPGGQQPVSNPVTTYPAPAAGGVPVTNPVAAPATSNAPAVPGQSWCVAKSGTSEAALQAALDYACGIGGADCSTIQQSGSCYNPNTLQNHASYAFNSYYQKNPAQTSCDFGGSAMVTNINPSIGSCIFPLSSSSSSTPATTTTPTPTPTTSSSSGATVPNSVSPPMVVNTSNPGSGITTVTGESPSGATTTSASAATGLEPFIRFTVLLASMITGRFVLGM